METKPYNFALIGVAGYVAPRHLKAIKETGNILLAALDKSDNVGILDSFFPETDFFVEFERFDRHIDKLRRHGSPIHYVSICSPNYLHDSHVRFALRNKADAICEKPLVLNPWNVDGLKAMEEESGHRVFNILQLRLHPAIIALKEKIRSNPSKKLYDVDLTYITSRGRWYAFSWKGDVQKSGGVATNIGIHFFDMLSWIFGKVTGNTVHLSQPDKAAGILELQNAYVRWYLSIDAGDLPTEVANRGQRTFRSIKINGEEIEFSEGFTDLHTRSYEEILKGNGFGLEDVRPSVEIAYTIRHQKPQAPAGEYHPFLKL